MPVRPSNQLKNRLRASHYLFLGFLIAIFALHAFWDTGSSNSRSYNNSGSYSYFFGSSRNVKKGKQFGIATISKPSRPPVSGYVLVDPDVDLAKKSTAIELDELLQAVDAATTNSYPGHQSAAKQQQVSTTKHTITPPKSITSSSSSTTNIKQHQDAVATKSTTTTGSHSNSSSKSSSSISLAAQQHQKIIDSTTTTTTNTNDIDSLQEQYPTCKIYVLDPDAELSAGIGLPHCDLKKVWPFNKPGNGVEGLDKTPHWAAQHASGYWLAKSIQNSFASTDDIRSADIVYVNTHCYSTWYAATRFQAQRQSIPFQPINDAAITVSRLFIEGVMAMKQYTRTAGRRYAISRPVLGSPPGAMMDTCAKLKRSFIIASERGIFCDNDRDRAVKGDSLIVPYVVVEHVNVTALAESREHTINTNNNSGGGDDGSMVQKSMLLTYRGECASESQSSPASTMVKSMIKELEELTAQGERISVACDKKESQFKESIQAMQSSTFCIVVPSPSRQATRALPAAVLSGCIPVFFGSPFHALPLAQDIQYRSMAVFFNITESGRWQPPEGQDVEEPPPPGELETNSNLDGAVISVATFKEAVEYLKAIPATTVAAMHAALEKESPKFYYPAWPGTKESALGRIAVKRMCDYAARLNDMLAARDAARAENPHQDTNAIPKLTQDELAKMDGGGDDSSIAKIGRKNRYRRQNYL